MDKQTRRVCGSSIDKGFKKVKYGMILEGFFIKGMAEQFSEIDRIFYIKFNC